MSKLESFNLSFEYDMSWSDVKKIPIVPRIKLSTVIAIV